MEIIIGFALGSAFFVTALWTRSRFLSFSAQRPGDYAGADTSFDIRQHLNGPILCEGVVFGPTGRVASRFVADMHATWDGNAGRMTERFRYSSGETQDRAWRLTLLPGGRIRAETDDLVGTGEGSQNGTGVKLTYRIRLPESAGGHVLDAIDWMYLVDNGTIINRSQFRKFGITVAELVATMRPAVNSDESQKAA